MEIEFCTIGCEDCEYLDDLQVYENKMNEEFNAFYRAFRLDEVNNKSTQGKFQTRDELYEKFREDYEKNKFDTASKDVKDNFTKAEKIVAMNTPLMNFCVYLGLAGNGAYDFDLAAPLTVQAQGFLCVIHNISS